MNAVIVAVSRNGGHFESMIPQLDTHNLTWIRSVSGEPALATIDRYMPDLVAVYGENGDDERVLSSNTFL